MAKDDSDFSYFRLRIPANLKVRIEALADEAGRSMNAQVLHTLQLALDQTDELEQFRQEVDDHEERIKSLEKDVLRLIDSGGLDYYNR